MVMKELSWYLTKFVCDLIAGVANRRSELVIKNARRRRAARVAGGVSDADARELAGQ